VQFLARERILVKDAMDRVKKALRELLKFFTNENFNDDHKVSQFLDVNILSLALKFLSETKKIDDVLFEISKTLEMMQVRNNNVETKINIWDNEFIYLNSDDYRGAWIQLNCFIDEVMDIDDFYDNVIYTTSRTVEGLSITNDINEHVIINGLDFIYRILQKVELDIICDELYKCVPIVQGIINGLRFVDEQKREKFANLLNQIREYVLDLDPELRTVYGQDVYYSIRSIQSDRLEEEELEPLYRNLESGVYRNILKGIEFLSKFGIHDYNHINDTLLTLTSRYFNNLFKISNNDKNGFYYSSIAESVYNILKFSTNRAFAETVMNLLTEDSGWIYYRELDILDIYRIIIGGGLLVLARAALRK